MKLDAELPMDVDTGSNAAQTHGNGAPPAAASFVWHTRPDGNVDLPPAGAAVDDADDPEEDDVNMMLQVLRVHLCVEGGALTARNAGRRLVMYACVRAFVLHKGLCASSSSPDAVAMQTAPLVVPCVHMACRRLRRRRSTMM